MSEEFYDNESIEPSTTIIEREGKLGLRGNLDGDNTIRKEVIEIKTLGENYYDDPSAYVKKLETYRIQVCYYMGIKNYLKGTIFIFKRPAVLLDKPFDKWTVKEMFERQSEVEEFIVKEMDERLEMVYVDPSELFMPLFDKYTDLADEVNRRIELIDKAYEKHSERQEKTVEGDDEDLLVEFKELEEMEKTVATRKKEILEHFIEKYHENETFEIDGNSYVYTAERTGTRKSFNSKAFESDNPELYKKYIKESTVSYKPSLKVK